MQPLGLIRFSYATVGGFQIQFDSHAELCAYLYSDARLSQRFAFFEHICLPSIRAQTDPDFTIALVTGADMPERWLERLWALTEDVPQVEVLAYPPLRQLEMVAQVIGALKSDAPEDDWIGHFRLDDDDAIARDFIEDMRKRARKVCRLADAKGRVSLDYNHGYVLRPSAGGICAEAIHARGWTPAQVIFLRQDNHRTIIHFPHHKLDRMMPVVTVPERRMWIRSVNDFNDSGTNDFPKRIPQVSDADRDIIRNRFGVDLDAFHAAVRSHL